MAPARALVARAEVPASWIAGYTAGLPVSADFSDVPDARRYLPMMKPKYPLATPIRVIARTTSCTVTQFMSAFLLPSFTVPALELKGGKQKAGRNNQCGKRDSECGCIQEERHPDTGIKISGELHLRFSLRVKLHCSAAHGESMSWKLRFLCRDSVTRCRLIQRLPGGTVAANEARAEKRSNHSASFGWPGRQRRSGKRASKPSPQLRVICAMLSAPCIHG
jgi:hypothetical protein